MIKYVNGRGQMHRVGAPAVIDDDYVQYWQNGRLHREDGPAVITHRGGKQYFWKGVQINESLWSKSSSLAIHEIMAHPNAEIRRALVEKRGWKRLLDETKPRVIHTDPERSMTLYEIAVPDDEPIVVLSVLDGTTLNDGSRKQYFLRVPPSLTDCLTAAAWTFRMTPDEYKGLELET